MSITLEIVRSWTRPRAVTRRQLDAPSEARALAHLVIGCLLIFVAQWPRLSREAYLDPSVPLDARIGGALMGIMFIAPLLLYALAALSHLIARLMGGRGTWLSARIALFWTLLATAPLFLLYGLVAGFIGQGPALSLTGLVALSGFLAHWVLALAEAEGIGSA
jgi:hypothetical protein